MEKVLITGGTGLIGKALIPKLLKLGFKVNVLSRSKIDIKGVNVYQWNLTKDYIEDKAFDGINHIIHLAGASIADKRWSEKRKKEIIDSRVESANLIFKKVIEKNILLKSFISSSGISYYGAKTTPIIFSENNEAGTDYLGDVCVKWENAAHQFKNINANISIIRTGIVLSNDGGALAKMKTPIVSPIASGKQFIPWIHIDDICSIYIESLKGNLIGVFNAAAPEHQTNYSFSKLLAKSFKKPFLAISVPTFILKIALGEMSILLTEGSRVSTTKIIEADFKFKFYSLEKAFKDLS